MVGVLSLSFLLIVFPALNTAHAELVLSVYGGAAGTYDSDVKLKQPGGTDLTFSKVSWDDDSFESPPYYGLRLAWWLKGSPKWGFMLDFTHAKMIADLSQVVAVDGSRDGMPVTGQEPLTATFDNLQFSHGHNMLTFNLMHRWFAGGERDKTFLGRLQPYVGLGAGVAYPHVEIEVGGVKTEGYQLAGPAVEGLAGFNFDIFRHLSVFTEIKAAYAEIKADLKDGGTLEVKPLTGQLALGLSVGF